MNGIFNIFFRKIKKMQKLTILVVSGTYPPDIGGSELSIHTACKYLIKRGHKVLVIADERRKSHYITENVPVYGIPPIKLYNLMDELHNQYIFDVIITQLIYSPEALKWGNEKNIPTIYFIRNNQMKLDLSPSSPYHPTILVANSKYILLKSKNRWDREIELIYPFIDLKKVISNKRKPMYITIINPLVIKGGKIFLDIVKNYPNRKFLAILGWTGLRKRNSLEWDPIQWERIALAHNDKNVHPPEEIDFSGIKNLKIKMADKNIRKIYQKTRLLLFPSQWDEAFGRCIVEALTSGIPVIASDVGGIRETGLEKGGIILEKDISIEHWFRAIERLDDPSLYKQVSQNALFDARKYSLEEQIIKLENICYRCIRLD